MRAGQGAALAKSPRAPYHARTRMPESPIALKRTYQALKRRQRAWRERTGQDLATPAGRRQARLHMHLADYAFLRALWTNMHEIAPGVWRSNQPGPGRFDRLEATGLRAIINLRGQEHYSTVRFEAEECARRGIALHHLPLEARALVAPEHYLALLDLFDRLERPFLMHCKSGADRAGLAAAFYLIDQEGADLATARAQLSPRYLHFKGSATGILDHMLEAWGAQPLPLRQWLAEVYDPEALTRSYLAGRKPTAAQ